MKSFCITAAFVFASIVSVSQNVGIGTSSPQRQLHLNGSGEVLRVQGITPWIGLLGQADADYNGFLYYPDTSIVLGTKAATDKQVVLAPNNSGVLWASPLNGGRTGIGISQPQNKLHVLSATAGDGLRITAPSPAVYLYESATEKGYLKITPAAMELGSASLPLNVLAGGNTVFTAGTTGNIGAGTAPLSNTKMYINGDVNNDVLRISGTNQPGISWYVGNSKAGTIEIGSLFSSRFFDIKTEAITPVVRFTDASTGNTGMTIAPATGDVVMGNSTTPGTLEVNGTTRLGSALSGAPAIKMKLITGLMPTAGNTLQYSHSLALSQVISVTILSDGLFGNRKVPPGNTFSGNEYTYLVFPGNIEITTTATNSGNVVSRPVNICIIYTE